LCDGEGLREVHFASICAITTITKQKINEVISTREWLNYFAARCEDFTQFRVFSMEISGIHYESILGVLFCGIFQAI